MTRFAFLLAVLCFAAAPARAADPFKMISPDEVQALLGKPGVHVYDVNPPERYAQGHLPGARLVTPENVAEKLPAEKDATLVFYCMNPK